MVASERNFSDTMAPAATVVQDGRPSTVGSSQLAALVNICPAVTQSVVSVVPVFSSEGGGVAAGRSF